MVSKNEFEILKFLCLNQKNSISEQEIAIETKFSLETVNRVMKQFREKKWVDMHCTITEAGKNVLEPYRVKNAVIMAAGLSSRFAPLSYEKPKGLLNVKGEILIERQIRQLQESGITDITLVVGYMKEKFFYLADQMGVTIVVNDDYSRYNNTATLMLVLDRLDNTYICSSDDYFAENVFEPYVYSAYYAAVYTDQVTDEYCMTTNAEGRITNVTIGGGPNVWYMLGHAYFSHEFCQKFVPMLREEFEAKEEVRQGLWEKFYIRHLEELHMDIRKYEDNVIFEFDSLDELRAFDDKYLKQTGSEIFRNICRTLHCAEADIQHIVPLKAQQAFLAFRFVVDDHEYVYRHLLQESRAYISQNDKADSIESAKQLGLADTFIAMDLKQGWQMSRYADEGEAK